MMLTNFSWQWYDHQKARQPPTCHMSSHWQQYVSYACQKACQGHRKHFGFHSYANSIASPVSDGHLPMEFKRTWLALLRWPGSPDDRWSLLSAPVVKPLPNLAFLQSYHHDRSRQFIFSKLLIWPSVCLSEAICVAFWWRTTISENVWSKCEVSMR